MRFVRKEPSGVDGTPLPVFKLNKDELRLLHALLERGNAYLPRLKEYRVDVARTRNMKNVIQRYFLHHENQSSWLSHKKWVNEK